MRKPSIELSPKDIDIKQMSLDILRDLYSASRKLMMYPIDHPVTNETLKKPLATLNDLFTFKRSFVINMYNNRLAAEGLLLEDAVYVNGMIQDLSRHDIQSVAFEYNVTPGDLFNFLTRLIESKNPINDYIENSLKKMNIKTIHINDDSSSTLFNFNDTVIGNQNFDYRLHGRLIEIIKSNPDAILGYYHDIIKYDDDIKMSLGIDLRYNSLKNIFPETLAAMDEDNVLDLFQKALYSSDWLDESIDSRKLKGISRLWQDYAATSEDVSILLPVYVIFKSVGVTDELLEKIFDRGALIKLKAVRDAEEFIELLKTSKAKEINFEHLRKTVFKLATDSHSNPLEKLLKQLIRGVTSEVLDTRQRSLRLSIEALQTLSDGSFWEIYSAFIREVLRIMHKPSAGQELIELIGWVIENSAENGRWEELKICIQTLRGLSREENDIRSAKAMSKLNELMDSSIMTDILTDAA